MGIVENYMKDLEHQIEKLEIDNHKLQQEINDLRNSFDYSKENETYENVIEHIQLIQTYTDDERVLAQCNLILKELEDE